MKLFQNVILATTLLSSSSLLFASPVAKFAIGYARATFFGGFGATTLAYSLATKEEAFHHSQDIGEFDAVNTIDSTILRAPFRGLSLPVRLGRQTAEAIFITDVERDKLKATPLPEKSKPDSDQEKPPIFAALL